MRRHLTHLWPMLGLVVACSNEDSGGANRDVAGSDATVLFPDSAATTDASVASTALDTSVVDSAVEAETSGQCGAFGCACVENGDCLSGFCVPGLDGRFCTQGCVESCPEDFACRPIATGGDPVNACVPLHPNLCKPCREDAECKNPLAPEDVTLCVPSIDADDGSFCASTCSDVLPCPSGYTCSEVRGLKQCVPSDGTCECRPAWADMNLVTDCARTNAFGSCQGTRTCGDGGLTACDAAAPASESCNAVDDDCNGTTDDIAPFACPITNALGTCQGMAACASGGDVCVGAAAEVETCDGKDEDCDGTTDEDTCADTLACTTDTCRGPGDCGHAIDNGFCVIDGACVAENTPNPVFACQRCVPSMSQTTWSGDAENGQCFIAGECWPAGASKPNEPCFRCRPDVSTTTWSPASAADNVACDDTFACTKNDHCSGGGCVGEPYSCNDGLGCTDDLCNGDGTCAYPIQAGHCLVNNLCYDDGQRPDDATCRICDADVPTQFSAPGAVSCDDNNTCTVGDVCAGSVCGGTELSCDDGLVCTTDGCNANGSCSNTLKGGFCLIDGACYLEGATSPTNPCLVCKPSVSPIFWSAKANGDACDDGDACTYGDKCSFGECFSIPYDCIGKGCCVGDGTCTAEAPVGAIELCENAIDDDCDGITDEGVPEVCGDNVDNDCDGQEDESGNTWGEVFFARSWRTPPTIAVYTSRNDGTFDDPQVLDIPGGPYAIAGVGDFDGDGFNDLIVSSSVYQTVTACNAATPCAAGRQCVGGGCVPTNCALADPNSCSAVPGTQCNDTFELNDAAAVNTLCYPPTQISLVRERCPEGSNERQPLFTMDPAAGIGTIADLDNDGDLDFVIIQNWSRRRGYVERNDSAGGVIAFTRIDVRPNTTEPMLTMPTGTNYPPINAPCPWVYSVSKTAKDIDGDGLIDLLGNCNPNGGSTPSTLWWWKGRGDGSFGLKQDLVNLNTTAPGGGTTPTPFGLLTMNDFNRDGHQDVVGGIDDDGNAGAIWPILGRGAGASLNWLWGTLAFDVMPVTVPADGPGQGGGGSADLDDDGYADLLVGWVPNRSECQNAANAACIYAELAFLKNVTGASCDAGQACNASGQCAQCFGACSITAECGSNGCGGTCGAGCDASEICVNQHCVAAETCTPNCAGKTCGDNGCGGVCGECAAGSLCKAGACVAASTCGTCVGKTCGTDDCGTPCVFFEETYHIASDTNSRGAEVPSNAPPTRPTIQLQPTAPSDSQDLLCNIVVDSYDLDPVHYRYHWYRNGAYYAAASNRPVVPAAQTSIGQTWRCEVVASDDLEYAPRVVSNTVTITGIAIPIDGPADPR